VLIGIDYESAIAVAIGDFYIIKKIDDLPACLGFSCLAELSPAPAVVIIIRQSTTAINVFRFMFDLLLSCDKKLPFCARYVLSALVYLSVRMHRGKGQSVCISVFVRSQPY